MRHDDLRSNSAAEGGWTAIEGRAASHAAKAGGIGYGDGDGYASQTPLQFPRPGLKKKIDSRPVGCIVWAVESNLQSGLARLGDFPRLSRMLHCRPPSH